MHVIRDDLERKIIDFERNKFASTTPPNAVRIKLYLKLWQ